MSTSSLAPKPTSVPTVSVLMAVYQRDNPSDFSAALDSLRPFIAGLAQVVLVSDGPLTPDLESVITERAETLKIETVRLAQSVGLGEALNAGLAQARSDYVLRMDADDISRPERLHALQARLASDPSIDVLGSFIAEFDSDPTQPHAIRRVPLEPDDIARRMRVRCAMNHVSCLLRTRTVVEAGGYQGGSGFAEDWWLWARLLARGGKFANVEAVLVDVRVGNGFVARRRGWALFKQDLRLLRMMRKIGFVRWHEALAMVGTKVIQRTLPAAALSHVYRIIRRH